MLGRENTDIPLITNFIDIPNLYKKYAEHQWLDFICFHDDKKTSNYLNKQFRFFHLFRLRLKETVGITRLTI